MTIPSVQTLSPACFDICYSLFKFQGGDIGIITSVLRLFFYCLPVYYDKPWNLNLYKVVKLINRQVCKLQYVWNKKPV